MTTEKRPQDWTVEEKLKRVIVCGDRNKASVNQRCREQGIYPHHLAQWQTDFVEGKSQADKGASRAETRQLKQENKALKKE
ncbi:MAG: transposase [Candidatus Azotimanducaceae bacterium WSBS_2022_MAG_OTU7]